MPSKAHRLIPSGRQLLPIPDTLTLARALLFCCLMGAINLRLANMTTLQQQTPQVGARFGPAAGRPHVAVRRGPMELPPDGETDEERLLRKAEKKRAKLEAAAVGVRGSQCSSSDTQAMGWRQDSSSIKWVLAKPTQQPVKSCNPFKGAKLTQSSIFYLYKLPWAYGGHGFYEGISKPAWEEEDKSPSLKPISVVPEKYVQYQCRSKGSGKYKHLQSVEPPQLQGLLDSAPTHEWAGRLMGKLAGQHLVCLGDSLLRQVVLGFMCVLSDLGVRPVKVTFSKKTEMQATYPNGLVISRYALVKAGKASLNRMRARLGAADVAIVTLGRHYHFKSNRSEYADHMDQIARVLGELLKGRGLLLETLPAHFPTPSGEWSDPRGKISSYHRNVVGYVCTKFKDYNGAFWQNEAMSAAAARHGVGVIRWAGALAARWDAHMGWDGPAARQRGKTRIRTYLDCVHWCWSSALFWPLISRLSAALHDALGCPAPERQYLHREEWQRLVPFSRSLLQGLQQQSANVGFG